MSFWFQVVSTSVNITVVDINDNAPHFDKTSYSFNNITEETMNIPVGKVHVSFHFQAVIS